MSPELFKNKPYSYKSDVWAFGCVLYEMCNLRHAFDAQSINGLAMKILRGSYPPVSPFYSKRLAGIIKEMISVNPGQRPSLTDLLGKDIIRRAVTIYIRNSTGPESKLNPVNI